jgi:NitT/TauT family transport system ATP-binding protein
MTKSLHVGYVPLTDAALLHIAKTQGCAAAHGLDIELVAESSWANIRDKLITGHLDAAHMLAPAAIAVSLGIGQVQAPLLAPVALGLNGNAITVSHALYDSLLHEAQGGVSDPRSSAKALASIVKKRREAGHAPLTFGHVFPFSSHHYQLRLWMRAGGIDPDDDVRLIVVPPPFMVGTLRKGLVDGFCVGAPWNSLAAAAGAGTILHQGTEIVLNCPEKILAFREEWARAHEDSVRAFAAAILDAAHFAAAPGNRGVLIPLLSRMAGQDISPEVIGEAFEDPEEPSRLPSAAAGLRIDEGAIRADPGHALWVYAQMVAAGQCPYSEDLANRAAAVYQPLLGPPLPGSASAPQIFDGPPFSPKDLHAYVAAMTCGRPTQ